MAPVCVQDVQIGPQWKMCGLPCSRFRLFSTKESSGTLSVWLERCEKTHLAHSHHDSVFVCVLQKHQVLSRSELWRTTGTSTIRLLSTCVLEILLWSGFYLQIGRIASPLSHNCKAFVIRVSQLTRSGSLMECFLFAILHLQYLFSYSWWKSRW